MALNGGEATEMMRSSSEEPAKKRKKIGEIIRVDTEM